MCKPTRIPNTTETNTKNVPSLFLNVGLKLHHYFHFLLIQFILSAVCVSAFSGAEITDTIATWSMQHFFIYLLFLLSEQVSEYNTFNISTYCIMVISSDNQMSCFGP